MTDERERKWAIKNSIAGATGISQVPLPTTSIFIVF
jgi:hypothetical protein